MESMTNVSIRSLRNAQCVYKTELRDIPEDELIRRAQRGDLEAFNALVLLHQDRVFNQARWILNDETSAEDACQEAFLTAYLKIHTFHGGPFRPWLLRIVTNICIDQIRAAKRRRRQSLELANPGSEEIEAAWVKDPADLPEGVVEQAEMLKAICQSLQRLAPMYRTPVILIDLQELDYAEASAILRIPMGTLKSRLARARVSLRQYL